MLLLKSLTVHNNNNNKREKQKKGNLATILDTVYLHTNMIHF